MIEDCFVRYQILRSYEEKMKGRQNRALIWHVLLRGKHGSVRSRWYPLTHELVVGVVCID